MIKHKIWWKAKLPKTQPRILKNGNSNIKLSNGRYGSNGRFSSRAYVHSDQMSVLRNKLKLSLGGMNLLKAKQFMGKISGMIQTNEYTVKRKIIPLRIRTLIESDHNYHYDHLSMNFSHEIMVV